MGWENGRAEIEKDYWGKQSLYVLQPDFTLWSKEMLRPDENSSSAYRESAEGK